MPVISIIIATWNAARDLPTCLDSIRAQRGAKAEVIVADGGSSDTTVEVIRSFPDVVSSWWSAKDAGIYDAWNNAIGRATGDYIMFLGSDDSFAHAEVLSRLERQVVGTSVDIATSLGQMRGSEGRLGAIIGNPWSLACLPRRFRVCHPGLLHHRSLFQKYGLFDATYRIAADFEFACRLPTTLRTLHFAEVAVFVGDGGISRDRFWQRIRETREIHRRNPSIGPVKAWLYWADKVWRRPIAKALDLPH